jgi:hypothetical protein
MTRVASIGECMIELSQAGTGTPAVLRGRLSHGPGATNAMRWISAFAALPLTATMPERV